MRYCIQLRWIVLCVVIGICPDQALGTPPNPLCLFLGHRLGSMTNRDLESLLGKGRVTIGGHPDSGRYWSMVGGTNLRTDGFDADPDGTSIVVNRIELSGKGGTIRDSFPVLARGRVGPIGRLRWHETKEDTLDSLLKLGAIRQRPKPSAPTGPFEIHAESIKKHYLIRFGFSSKGLESILWEEL